MTSYHDDPAPEPSLSSSIANVLLTRSPRHAWTAHPRLNPDYERETSDAFDLGTVVHAIMLERKVPEEVVRVCDFPDWRSNAAKEARAAAREEGWIALLPKDWERVRDMTLRAWEQIEDMDVYPPLLDHGEAEVEILWEEDGIWLRSKLDWLHSRDHSLAIDDLKTTSRSAAPASYAKTLYSTGGDIQAAFYRRAVSQEYDLATAPPFRWIVCETSPPYAVSAITPGADVLAIGEAKVLAAIELWRRLVNTPAPWPAYSPTLHEVNAPAWEEANWLARAVELGLA